MGHSRAAYRLDERLLDNAVLDIKGKFAAALLRSTPAYAMRQA
jgi:hypothetical protein